MAHYNPFQNSELRIPKVHQKQVEQFCQTQPGGGPRPSPDDSPFPRQVDFWFLAVCIGAKNRDRKAEVNKWHRFNIGTVLDPHMVELLELLAISIEGDAWVIEKPSRVIEISNELAAIGVPEVIDMLNDGKALSVWNLTDRLGERYFAD